MRHVRWAIQISRPLLWLNTSMPFLWALARGRERFRPARPRVPRLLHLPVQLLPPRGQRPLRLRDRPAEPPQGRRRGSARAEGGAPPPRDREHRCSWSRSCSLSAAKLPWRATASLLALLGLSMAYNAPPLRLKGRPVADSLDERPLRHPAAGRHARHGLDEGGRRAGAGLRRLGDRGPRPHDDHRHRRGRRGGRRHDRGEAGPRCDGGRSPGPGSSSRRSSRCAGGAARRRPSRSSRTSPSAPPGGPPRASPGGLLYRWFLALNVTLGAAVTLAVILPLGVAQALYVGALRDAS